MAYIPFIKMHGIGNDFVIFDGRKVSSELIQQHATTIANRHKGVGCDQIIVIEPSQHADCFMRIYNADGSQSGACGNATRCIAYLKMLEEHKEVITIETLAGILEAHYHKEEDMIRVSMGKARLLWHEIPLVEERDTACISLPNHALQEGIAVNMGNPHIVFFVEDIHEIDLIREGALIEHDHLFPERVNVNVAHIESSQSIRLRVWERGSGETLACGSGACATVVAACKRGFVAYDTAIEVILPGGSLYITVTPDDEVTMMGTASTSYTGIIDL